MENRLRDDSVAARIDVYSILRDILRNQFASAPGITLFLISVFLFLFNVVVLQAVENSGRDL